MMPKSMTLLFAAAALALAGCATAPEGGMADISASEIRAPGGMIHAPAAAWE